MRKGLVIAMVIAAASIAAVLLGPRPDAPPRTAKSTSSSASPQHPAVPPVVDAAPRADEVDEPHFWAIPDDLETQIPLLENAAAAGSADAAYELFRLTWQCAPPRYPRNAADVTRHAEEIRSWTGRVVDQERELAKHARQRELCEAIARRALPGHVHWLDLAAERGHHGAMVGYWHTHRVEHATYPDRYDVARLETVRANAVGYLTAARDAGAVDAFAHIGAGQAGLLPSSPFEPDDVEGLAHLYAVGMLDPAEGEDWARYVRKVEMRVPAYALAEARERAEELIDDCCR